MQWQCPALILSSDETFILSEQHTKPIVTHKSRHVSQVIHRIEFRIHPSFFDQIFSILFPNSSEIPLKSFSVNTLPFQTTSAGPCNSPQFGDKTRSFAWCLSSKHFLHRHHPHFGATRTISQRWMDNLLISQRCERSARMDLTSRERFEETRRRHRMENEEGRTLAPMQKDRSCHFLMPLRRRRLTQDGLKKRASCHAVEKNLRKISASFVVRATTKLRVFIDSQTPMGENGKSSLGMEWSFPVSNKSNWQNGTFSLFLKIWNTSSKWERFDWSGNGVFHPQKAYSQHHTFVLGQSFSLPFDWERHHYFPITGKTRKCGQR